MNETPEIMRFLDEDYGRGDITSDNLIPRDLKAKGEIVSKEAAILAGAEEVSLLLGHMGLNADWLFKDGDSLNAGDIIVKISGSAREMLAVERVSLNILGHMSGIATTTQKATKVVSYINSNIKIAATRKTIPGLRHMEKKAIKLGGGDPHRFDLSDLILIKDNHLSLTGSIRDAVRKVRESVNDDEARIEVEVATADDAIEAARSGVDTIMLDNMSVEAMEDAISRLNEEELRDRVTLEGSGGINFENLEAYAKTGIDTISMGILTNSSHAIDMGFKIRRESK